MSLQDDSASHGDSTAARADEPPWRALVENSPDYIFLCDRDTTIRYVNRTGHGFRPEEVVGRRGADLVSPEQSELIRRRYEEVWDSGQAAAFDSPVPSPDG